MAELTLYRVDARGRLNLAGVIGKGVEFYTAELELDELTNFETGRIILAPVRVATTSVKRTTEDSGQDN